MCCGDSSSPAPRYNIMRPQKGSFSELVNEQQIKQNENFKGYSRTRSARKRDTLLARGMNLLARYAIYSSPKKVLQLEMNLNQLFRSRFQQGST